MEGTFKTCLDQISKNKSFFTDNNMLKTNPANEYHQIIPYYEGKYERRKKILILSLQEKL